MRAAGRGHGECLQADPVLRRDWVCGLQTETRGPPRSSPFLHLPNPSPDPSPPKCAPPIPVSSSPLLASVTLLWHPCSCLLTSPLQPSVPLPGCFPYCIQSGYLKCSEVTPLLKTARRRSVFLGTRILSAACQAPCDLATPSFGSVHTVPGLLSVLCPGAQSFQSLERDPFHLVSEPGHMLVPPDGHSRLLPLRSPPLSRARSSAGEGRREAAGRC